MLSRNEGRSPMRFSKDVVSSIHNAINEPRPCLEKRKQVPTQMKGYQDRSQGNKKAQNKHPPTPRCPGPIHPSQVATTKTAKHIDVVAHTRPENGIPSVRSQIHVLVFFLEADPAMAGGMPILRLSRAVASTVGATASAVESWA